MRVMIFLKKCYFLMWKKVFFRLGNVHLAAENARKFRLPFSSSEAYLRQSVSDAGRVGEYLGKIYQKDSYLHEALVNSCPSVLLDVGANIGLSTLSLIGAFPSIKRVIAIEAEEENYKILERNFRLWGEQFENIEFQPIFAVATHDVNVVVSQADSLADLTGNNSASGTFRFVCSSEGESSNRDVCKAISVNDLFRDIPMSENIVAKVDIEGGEEYLFSDNTNWVERCTFITMELHDRFHPSLLNSSRNTIAVLSKCDFALAASEDVLYCYKRDLICS
jgi:FkbM family methyltransferase